MKNSWQGTFRSLLHAVVGGVVLVLLMHTWAVMGLVVPVAIHGDSMEPTLSRGSRVIVDRAAYLWHKPQRWDVVVFRCPTKANELCVKRIVGLPGETVSLAGGHVLVDGEPLSGNVQFELRYQDLAAFRARHGSFTPQNVKWQLGESEYFVLGDHSSVSEDSRSWWHGPGLPAALLVGKALGVRRAGGVVSGEPTYLSR
jgi:signal peptidase I